MTKINKTIIAIIPARGGSKGVKKKNIRMLGGKTLIHYTISAAQKSEYIDHVIVSTDDSEIRDVALSEGAKVIIRPAKISGDDSSTIEAIFHAMDEKDISDLNPDVIVLLQPTSPFRTSSDIDAALELFLQNDCDSVISVTESNHSPYWNMLYDGEYLEPLFEKKLVEMRRQDLPKTYLPNGAIYIASIMTLKSTRSFYSPKTKPYFMSAEKSIDIDSEFDLMFAEALMKR
ncbi:MAG: acylneuraminate cytidylyltransferase family protein [Methanomicrobiaceae archaeon]|nr:acylneuraminate cytidylyltransferase family protein [Methanomicrobiaceae archaeon]